MSYRLLHLADIHLDRAFAAMGCQGELARRRRQGLRDALRRAGDTAREQRCDAISIAGDLYEHERAGVDSGRFLAETFASWRPLPVFIAPGNHDALMPGSLYRRTDWPDNVHIFSEPHLTPVQLTDGLTLWGLAHREPAWQGDPLDCEPPEVATGVHLALFHGAELGSRPEGKSIHGPFRVERIRAQGFAAALSGHYHRRRLDEAGGLLYPGTLEPLTFDETGARGPVVVEVDGAGRVAFRPHDDNRWSAMTISVDVSDCSSRTGVLDCAHDACASAIRSVAPQRTMVRLDLTGELDPAISADTATLEAVLREQCDLAAVKVRDLTVPAFDLESAASEPSTRGAFIRATLAAIESAGVDESEELRDALGYGLAALSGVEVGLR